MQNIIAMEVLSAISEKGFSLDDRLFYQSDQNFQV